MDKSWISINERLPDKPGQYKTLWCDRFENINEFIHGTFFCLVTHWKDESIEPERTFTLAEALEIWTKGYSEGLLTEFGYVPGVKEKYFKEKFNIDLNK